MSACVGACVEGYKALILAQTGQQLGNSSGTATQLYFDVIIQIQDRRNWCSCATGGNRDLRLTCNPLLKTLH